MKETVEENHNICRFIPMRKDYEAIHTVNFVLETKWQSYDCLKSNSVSRMNYVTSGEGILHTPGHARKLEKGDIFFVLPAVPFAIESLDNFEFMYISYIGSRADMLMDKLGISGQNCVFPGFPEVEEFWKSSLEAESPLYDLRSESVLLYTFSVMGSRLLVDDKEVKKEVSAAELIKKYVDDNFSDEELSLEKISLELSYHKKYLSSVFKNRYRIGIVEYLNFVRIQHACALIEQGFTCVKDIAQLCGFKDSLYFSKVFKKKMASSPREYMKTQG